jgi:hypothetical protein
MWDRAANTARRNVRENVTNSFHVLKNKVAGPSGLAALFLFLAKDA